MSIGYRPEIDGLRAVAVVPVILFHLNLNWIPGGFVGVDVFFVISGFLITSILIGDLESGVFSFSKFWARRIRRIIPPMLFVVATTLCFAWLFVFRGDVPAVGRQAIAGLLSASNVYFWKTSGDYWGESAENSPLLHTWSLAVEEQFYLCVPIAAFVVFRYRRSKLPLLFFLVVITSFTGFVFGLSAYPTSTFYLLPTRAWELAAGCCLAASSSRDGRARLGAGISSLLALLGLCLIVSCYFLVAKLNVYVIASVLGTVLILAFGQSGICYRILANRQLVHIGKLSYSLYLWHWPIFVFAEDLVPDVNKFLLLIPVFILATASYYLIETPARHSPKTIRLTVLSFSVTLAGAFATSLAHPFYDTSAFEQPTWIPYSCHPKQVGVRSQPAKWGTTKLLGNDADATAYLHGGIIVGSGNKSPDVVVLGDSHGCMWADAIHVALKGSDRKVSYFCMDGVSPFVSLPLTRGAAAWGLSPDEKYEYEASKLRCISEWRPKLVILCTNWSRQSESSVIDLMSFLTQNSSRVLLMEQPPELALGDRNILQYLCYRNVQPEVAVRKNMPCGNVENYEKGRLLIRLLSQQFANVSYIPVHDLYADRSEALVLVGRQVVYLDDDHLVTFGAHLAIPRIKQAIDDSLTAVRCLGVDRSFNLFAESVTITGRSVHLYHSNLLHPSGDGRVRQLVP
jgi:peptidoglycan/LPS O-acetylase OafA/YrhL